MAGSTNKKIVIHRFDRESLPGFVNPQAYLQPTGVEILTTSGNLLTIPYEDVKALYFVRDFEAAEPAGERLFHNRPKTSGVWIRMTFRDGEVMDGLMPNNLLQLEPYGFTFIPPAGSQKVFVPRAALSDLQVLAVVGSPLRPRKAKPKPEAQIELFE